MFFFIHYIPFFLYIILKSFFENVQSALDAGVRSEVVSYQFAFSKQELRKVIKEYPGKEVGE